MTTKELCKRAQQKRQKTIPYTILFGKTGIKLFTFSIHIFHNSTATTNSVVYGQQHNIKVVIVKCCGEILFTLFFFFCSVIPCQAKPFPFPIFHFPAPIRMLYGYTACVCSISRKWK